MTDEEKKGIMETSAQGYKVKCTGCGNDFYVMGENIKFDADYECPQCKMHTHVVFFGTCPDCHEKVGFGEYSWSQVALNVGKIALKGALHHGVSDILGAVKTITDSIPTARHGGICPQCNNYYIECVNCKQVVRFPKNGDIQTVVKCDKCGFKMRKPIDEAKKVGAAILDGVTATSKKFSGLKPGFKFLK
ncbi:MAG: hypothetical protein LBM77_01000 [Spirochaetaceae bacterium]|jgi:predicted nucleic acid-binding Zn ribbon protein|nr:hypothetical protein [Spirochaetaceae bacterium]